MAKCNHCGKEIESCVNAECIENFATLKVRLDNIKEGQDEIKDKISGYENKALGALGTSLLTLAGLIGSFFVKKL